MSRERHARVKHLLGCALDLPQQDREAFLRRECGDDEKLLNEARSLLAHDFPSFDPRDEVSPMLTAASADAERPERIGAYRIGETLGQGGMGIVYLAEQERPIRRLVALKLIKIGMDTAEVISRFEAERQALALMDHPHVARVFEAGATPEGRPYFVMEYVKGSSITEHCDRERLSMDERLVLFQKVSEGVQHAHQKAIIHRDLKPSNVLVTVQDGVAVPKIIDFGVAKATAQRLTEQSILTELGQLIGTPAYMSPEQADLSGENVDTRTDVYSLGVLLYELLVGALPFDAPELRRFGLDEIRRRIREDEPSKPSTRLSMMGPSSNESAVRRRTDLRSLVRRLRGDLDWITMRAIEKDPDRRYSSPLELAEDIGRYLRDEPVLAGPPSRSYRLKKFVKRHRLVVSAAALVVLGVAVGVAGLSVGLLRARQAESEATHEAATSARVSQFLGSMLSSLDPARAGQTLADQLRNRVLDARKAGGSTDEELSTTLASFDRALVGVNVTDAGVQLIDSEILLPAAARIEEELTSEPEIAGQLHHTLGLTYYRLGRYPAAERHWLRALELRKLALGPGNSATLGSMSNTATVYKTMGRYEEAIELSIDAIELSKRHLGDDHEITLGLVSNLASLYEIQGRFDEAEQLQVEALQLKRDHLGDEHPKTLNSIHNLAVLYWRQQRYEEAESLMLETLETKRRTLGEEDLSTLDSWNNLGNLYLEQGRYEAAAEAFGDTLEIRLRLLGAEHPDTLGSKTNLASVYWLQGKFDEAERLQIEALEGQTAASGPEHPDTLMAKALLAQSHWRAGQHDRAAMLYGEILQTRRRVYGEDHLDTLGSIGDLGALYADVGRFDEARPLLEESLEGLRRVLGDDRPTTLRTMRNLAGVYLGLGLEANAQSLLEVAVGAQRQAIGDDHPDTLRSIATLAEVYKAQGDYDEAERLAVEGFEGFKRQLGPDHPDTRHAMENLAELYRTTGRAGQAAALFTGP